MHAQPHVYTRSSEALPLTFLLLLVSDTTQGTTHAKRRMLADVVHPGLVLCAPGSSLVDNSHEAALLNTSNLVAHQLRLNADARPNADRQRYNAALFPGTASTGVAAAQRFLSECKPPSTEPCLPTESNTTQHVHEELTPRSSLSSAQPSSAHGVRLLAALRAAQDTSLGPKIYIYPPPMDNPYAQVDCRLVGSRNADQWETQFGLQLTMLDNAQPDPEAADLFVIAINATCYTKWLTKTLASGGTNRIDDKDGKANERSAKEQVYQRYLLPYMLAIRQSPFFRRRNGADHVIPLAGDHGACAYYSEVRDQLLGDTIRVAPYGMDESQPARAVNQVWPRFPGCFMPQRDVVVPPYSDEAQLILSHPGWPHHNAPPQRAARPQLAYFGGGLRPSDPHHPLSTATLEYSGGVRVLLQLMTADERNTENGLLVHTPAPDAASRRSIGNRTLFCLCPGGQASWTLRPYECHSAGSLPVHLTDGNWQPFEQYIPYRLISMKLAHSSVPFLVRLLRRWLDTHREEELQRRVALGYEMLPYLLWSGSPRSNAAAMIMLELACKHVWIGAQHSAVRVHCGETNYRPTAFDEWL